MPTARVERVKLLAASCAHPFATAGFGRFLFVPSFTPWVKTPIGEGAGEEGFGRVIVRLPSPRAGGYWAGVMEARASRTVHQTSAPRLSGSALLMLCRSVNAFCLYSLY